ncbi:hypothetical protein TRFO_35176 [Tritrichomonas foetus]|uniref:Sel1 repeat family protein n=1 Tax=Tritrichomonas foetus TaxID=1144522 RepID=A0A1J4JH01_9EUKA|nr:hypothetical protein TRFO_35176 [Tritrichomonas foetus]|eukprot:OHS98434.1 hypothetical protein TRFO_35176 [Tritrichomonas foetus]
MLLKGLPRYPSNKNEVIHFLKMSADRDFHEAEEQLGLLLLEKEGINEDQYEINKKEAMKYFKKAAKAGRIESMLQLALLLLEYGGKDETAAKYIERTAKEKHPLGFYYFSLILEEGRGIEKDMKNSRKYLQMSADLNVPIAQHRLGVKLCEENKVPEGISYLRKACEANLVDAMMDLVRVLKQDDPVTYEEEIQSWLIKAAELGCCEAAVMAALYLVTKKKYYDAFNFFKMAALKGHIEGMFNYGKMLEEGLGTPIDRKEAVKYYRLSVDGGSIPAMFYLGRCYENGTGVEQSYINAAKLYRLSAENGDPEGMVGIGKLYKEGFGVDQNYEYALQYFQKAVGLGHVIGNYEFAKMYEFGLGTDEDKKVAYDHFKFASDRGHGPAMVFHAHDLLHGIAVEKDVEAGREVLMKAIALNEKDAMFEYAELLDFEGQSSEAFKYYRMSADLGHVQGMNCTAYILSQDEDKLEEAAKYLEKAADKDDMIAACNFGIALAQGKGIIRDQKRAVTYLRRAADSGIVEAMYNCGVLLITAKGDVRNEAEAKNMLKLASKNGHVKATFDLAMLIMTTEPNNIKETLDLLKTAADKGCVEANPLFAYYTLNNISKSAKGNDEINQENEETKKSLELAAKYAKKGAELGNTQSMVIYGSILLNGAGMNKSESDAVEYFKKAAEKGDVNGMFNYGSVLIRGVGVSQDQENGTKFLLEAMKNGHEYAQSLLDQFNIKY